MRLWSLHPRCLDAKGLVALWREGLLAQEVLRGKTRDYHFDRRCIARTRCAVRLTITVGQLRYELRHLRTKLRRRDPKRLRLLPGLTDIVPHPLFRVIAGSVESWERQN